MYKGNYGNAFQDLCFSIKHDSFIALGGEHNVTVWAFDPYRNGVHVTVLDTLHAEFGTKSSDVRCYIVDCRGELLILAKNGVYPVFDHVKNAYTYGTTCFLAFKVDFRSNKLVRVFKLNHAFFVGHNATLYVRPDKVHGITTGIYFTDDCEEAYSGAFLPDHDDEAELGGWRAEELALTPEEQILAAKWEMSSNRDDVPDAWKWGNRTLDPLLGGGRNSGIYHLDDGTIESLDAPETLSRICPPIWVAFPPQ